MPPTWTTRKRGGPTSCPRRCLDEAWKCTGLHRTDCRVARVACGGKRRPTTLPAQHCLRHRVDAAGGAACPLHPPPPATRANSPGVAPRSTGARVRLWHPCRERRRSRRRVSQRLRGSSQGRSVAPRDRHRVALGQGRRGRAWLARLARLPGPRLRTRVEEVASWSCRCCTCCFGGRLRWRRCVCARASSRNSRSWCSATSWLCFVARSPVRSSTRATASSLLRPAGCSTERADRSSSVQTRCWVGIGSLCGGGGPTPVGGRVDPRYRRRFVSSCCGSRVRI